MFDRPVEHAFGPSGNRDCVNAAARETSRPRDGVVEETLEAAGRDVVHHGQAKPSQAAPLDGVAAAFDGASDLDLARGTTSRAFGSVPTGRGQQPLAENGGLPGLQQSDRRAER
jgi:hypothetical protein